MSNFFNDIDRFNGRTAIVTENGINISYEELINDGKRLTDGLETRHVMFLVCRNCLESVCAYIAALRKEIVSIMINYGI
jgi:long-chain acyl-CoA synthetase